MRLDLLKTEAYQNLTEYADGGDLEAAMDKIALDRELGERSLKNFVRIAWSVRSPAEILKWNWHLDAVCEFFENFILGYIKKGIINIPPRTTKSTTGSVMCPTWGWIKEPRLQFLTLSYIDDLASRDSYRSRRLIESEWFQARWGDKFSLVGDQQAKMRYDNDQGGHRVAQSMAGSSTGEGGHRIIIDDPHNVKRAESDVERQKAILHYDEELSSRLNDQEKDCRVIIMQRLHERDLTGHCLEKDSGYVHLMLPMQYEPKRKCVIDVPNFSFADPRTEEGETLDNGRFPSHVIDDMKTEMTTYAVAGQLQQRPAPREGGMFEPSMFSVVETPPAGMGTVVRYWDKAGTDRSIAKGMGAHTAGVKMGRIKSGPDAGKVIILDVIRGQWVSSRREQIIENAAKLDSRKVKVFVEQEPGSGGKESAENTIKRLVGFTVRADRVTGDKVTRAEPYASQQIAGNVLVLKSSWAREFIREHEMFPVGAKKDQVDAAAGAFNRLADIRDGLTW